jgi:transforming growth factor-beta-induced protein
MKFAIIFTALASLVSAADSLEVVAKSANLTNFLLSIEKSNFTQTLTGLTNVTIFAPTNQAFDEAIEFVRLNNINITQELLVTILQLHIVPSVIFSSNITAAPDALQVYSLSGFNLTISGMGGNVTVSSPGNVTASVINADVEVSQGVVHIIDKVLLPDLSLNQTSGPGGNNGTGNGDGDGSGDGYDDDVTSSVFFQGISLFLSATCLLLSF